MNIMIFFLFISLLNLNLLFIPERITFTGITESENENEESVNCPCDLTFNTCDRNCECDTDCQGTSEYSLPGSNVPSSKYEYLLPICQKKNEYQITDLYSPLTIGYQILKKGLCLFKKDKDDDKESESDNFTEDKTENDFFQDERRNCDDENYRVYCNMGLFFPIMLPDGSCQNNVNYIRYLQDKKVICFDSGNVVKRYLNDQFNNNTNEINIFRRTCNYANFNDCSDWSQQTINYNLDNLDIIAKILIEFYVNRIEYENGTINFEQKVNVTFFNHSINNNEEANIFEVKFYHNLYEQSHTNIITKSGNPGYNKGNPILFFSNNRIVSGENSLHTLFSGVDFNGNCDQNFQYEDDIIDNTFTFEDNILYGCYLGDGVSSENDISFYNNIIFSENSYCKYGNGDFCNNRNEHNEFERIYNNEIDRCRDNSDRYFFYSINILYGAYGTKNNTQNKLLGVQNERHYCSNFAKDIPAYIKVNSFKVNLDTKWWHAPGPGLIRWKKNIMYPFRIGTTTYQKKN